MADGNGSNADKADNASLDGGGAFGGPSGSSGGSDVISGGSGDETIGLDDGMGNPNKHGTMDPMGDDVPWAGEHAIDPALKEWTNAITTVFATLSVGYVFGPMEAAKVAGSLSSLSSGLIESKNAGGAAIAGGGLAMGASIKYGLDWFLDHAGYVGPLQPAFENGPYMPNWGPPLVLDLDSDGLDLVALDKSKAFYDIDGDGFLENVGWVGQGDGFLSIDLNGDGLILEPVELAFALSTDDPDDTDLQGLAATYDSNQDGVLDINDAEFAKFKVWRDIDQDGVCDAGEVKSLSEHGITSINLKSDNKEEVIAGNKVYGTTEYTKSDGTTGKVGDVGLATSAAGWKKEEVTGGVKFNYEGTGDNAGKALFEAAAATALIMDVGASGLIGAMGAELDDDLSTSGKEDVILGGGAGNDTITGGAGNDWLAGGEGIDSLSGGAGHDILFVDSQDKIQGGDGFDVAIVTDDKAVNYDLAKIGIEAVSAGAGDDVIKTELNIQTDLDGTRNEWKHAA